MLLSSLVFIDPANATFYKTRPDSMSCHELQKAKTLFNEYHNSNQKILEMNAENKSLNLTKAEQLDQKDLTCNSSGRIASLTVEKKKQYKKHVDKVMFNFLTDVNIKGLIEEHCSIENYRKFRKFCPPNDEDSDDRLSVFKEKLLDTLYRGSTDIESMIPSFKEICKRDIRCELITNGSNDSSFCDELFKGNQNQKKWHLAMAAEEYVKRGCDKNFEFNNLALPKVLKICNLQKPGTFPILSSKKPKHQNLSSCPIEALGFNSVNSNSKFCGKLTTNPHPINLSRTRNISLQLKDRSIDIFERGTNSSSAAFKCEKIVDGEQHSRVLDEDGNLISMELCGPVQSELLSRTEKREVSCSKINAKQCFSLTVSSKHSRFCSEFKKNNSTPKYDRDNRATQ
ncbi:MAG: hypothetical protein AB8E15_07150 [Bdellovibrionales bacterium]